MVKRIRILKGVELKFVGAKDPIKDMKLLVITDENNHETVVDLKNNVNIPSNYNLIEVKKVIELYEDSEIGNRWV